MINLTQDTVGGMFDKYADMVYRIALNIVKSREEAQDIVMETFLALIKQEYFESGDHVKAWLIRTAQNKALNVMKSGRIRRNVPLDEFLENTLSVPASDSEHELLDLVMRPPGQAENHSLHVLLRGYDRGADSRGARHKREHGLQAPGARAQRT